MNTYQIRLKEGLWSTEMRPQLMSAERRALSGGSRPFMAYWVHDLPICTIWSSCLEDDFLTHFLCAIGGVPAKSVFPTPPFNVANSIKKTINNLFVECFLTQFIHTYPSSYSCTNDLHVCLFTYCDRDYLQYQHSSPWYEWRGSHSVGLSHCSVKPVTVNAPAHSHWV